MKQVKLLLMMAVFCFTAMTTQAAQAVSMDMNTFSSTVPTQKVTEKKGLVAKFTAKVADAKAKFLAKKLAKPGMDFSDPVKKWLWYAVCSWIAGLIIAIVGGVITAASVASSVTTGAATGIGIGGILAFLGWLIFLAGSVFFIIWLVKKFA
jgi:hypothetical protein